MQARYIRACFFSVIDDSISNLVVCKMKYGRLIVCDGSNGAGKSSVIEHLSKWLVDRGREVVVAREPGGTLISEAIRKMLLNPEEKNIGDRTELLLFAAARAQNVKENIKPALQSGKVVICDRFTPATVAFQHFMRGLPLDLVHAVNDCALDGISPDLNIIFDIDPLVAMERVSGRGEELDRFELTKAELLARARHGFVYQAQSNPEKFRLIDASKSFEEVSSEVVKIVEDLLKTFD